jgi:hypothetical protein
MARTGFTGKSTADVLLSQLSLGYGTSPDYCVLGMGGEEG